MFGWSQSVNLIVVQEAGPAATLTLPLRNRRGPVGSSQNAVWVQAKIAAKKAYFEDFGCILEGNRDQEGIRI
jgi:hypothetical protein